MEVLVVDEDAVEVEDQGPNHVPTGARPKRCKSRGGARPAPRSDGLGPALAGPDADAILHRQDENLAIADLAVGAAPARLDDRVDGRLDEILVHGDLELDLPEQVDGHLMPPIDLGIPLLPPEALHVRH